MTTRLEIINSGLLATKNEPCAVEFDGSPEWAVAFAAYERSVPLLLERGFFNFATLTAPLARTGDAPADVTGGWKHEFSRPAGALHIRSIMADNSPVPYQILDAKILTRVDGVSALYVREPPQSQWPALFVESLTMLVEAGLQRGLNEDYDEARAREREAWAMFETAAAKTDQEGPGRAVYVSRLRARRRGMFGGGT